MMENEIDYGTFHFRFSNAAWWNCQNKSLSDVEFQPAQTTRK